MIIILVDNSVCSYLNVNTNIKTVVQKITNNNCCTNNDTWFKKIIA